jgi:tetratricopeptide (TPR) repeat protein
MMFGSAVVRLLLLAGVLAGCAPAGAGPGADDAEPPRRSSRGSDMSAEAYYQYWWRRCWCRAAASGRSAPDAGSHQARPDSAYLWGSSRSGWSVPISRPRRSPPPGVRCRSPRATCRPSHPAELYRTQKNWPEAEAELETVIKLNPDAEEPPHAGPLPGGAEGVRPGARGPVRLVERQPKNVQAQFLLGRLAIETESWDEAITRLTRAVELDPDHDGAWTALGYVYESQRRTDEAIEVYRKAVKANPDNPAFVERLGDLLIRIGRYKDAQPEVEALTELAPRDPRVWMKMGAVYYEQKLYDRASDAFRTASALYPRAQSPYLALSRLAWRTGDRAGAVGAEQDLLPGPAAIVGGVLSSTFSSKAKQYDEAIALLREAINIDPRRPDLFLYLGTAHFRAKEYDRSIAALQEGLSLDDKQKDLRFQLGVVYEKQQKFDDAVREFRSVIALDPKHAEAYNYVGYMFVERGQNLDEAIDLINKALALEPDNGYFLDSLGWAFYQQGKFPDALRELKRAVDKAKEDPVIFEHLGDAYLKNGFDEDAATAWEKALQLDPAADGVKKKLDDLRTKMRRVQGERSKASQ